MSSEAPHSGSTRVAFGPFVADLRAGQLWKNGELAPLQDLPFRFLAALLEHPGEVVSRADLAAALWGTETYVDAEAGLNTAAAKLRQALKTGRDAPPLIETIPKRGYRLNADVRPADAAREPARVARPAFDGSALRSETRSSTVTRMQIAPARRPWRRTAAALIAVLLGGTAYRLILAKPAPIRVAVVLFDNETGRTDLDPFAQRLTDVSVAALTANRSLAVMGNAAVLRSRRPFRDIEKIHHALGAEYVIVGQVQNPDGALRVMTHLIRASDQAHVWIKATPAAGRLDAEIEDEVSRELVAAVGAEVGDQ